MLAVALAVRVGLVASTGEHVPWGDPVDYDRHAAHLVEHGSYPPSAQAAPGSPAAIRPPAWPYMLAGVYEATGARWTAGRLAAAGLGTLAVLLVYLIAAAAFGQGPARFAGWLAAVFPPMVFLSGSLVAENLFVPLMLAAVWATLRARRAEHPLRWALLAGAACGLAALTRTNGLALLLPVLIGLFQASAPPRLRLRAALAPALVLLATAVMIAPWTIRNERAFGEFVPVSTQGGYTMAAVWNAEADSPGPAHGRPQYGPLGAYQHRPGVDEVELDRTFRRMAREYAADHPGYVAELAGLNLLRMFKLASDESFTFFWNLERDMTAPRRVIDSLGLAAAALLALLALAQRRSREHLRRAPLWLWLFPAVMLASTILLLGNPRYRAPIDPFLVMVAAAALAAPGRSAPPRLKKHGALWRLYRRVRGAPRKKREEELTYWQSRKAAEGTLANEHYQAQYTQLVGLEADFYAGKDVLDIGCGPRGSLTWMVEARRRVGLDPLADDYRALGTDAHPMEYVAGAAEEMPFDDAIFDVVTSFNSLDHVDDLDRTIGEIKRVLRQHGHLVVAVEIGHEPTWSEPQTLTWDLCQRFEPELEVVEAGEYERGSGSLYDGAWRGEAFDHDDPTPRPGVLIAVLRRTQSERAAATASSQSG